MFKLNLLLNKREMEKILLLLVKLLNTQLIMLEREFYRV